MPKWKALALTLRALMTSVQSCLQPCLRLLLRSALIWQRHVHIHSAIKCFDSKHWHTLTTSGTLRMKYSPNHIEQG